MVAEEKTREADILFLAIVRERGGQDQLGEARRISLFIRLCKYRF
jgi:hypothetical protein